MMCVFVFSPAACCAVLWQEAGRRHESKNASVNFGQLSLLRQSLEQSERTDEHVRDRRTRKENNQTQQMNGPEERNMCAGCDDIRGSDIVSVQVYVTVWLFAANFRVMKHVWSVVVTQKQRWVQINSANSSVNIDSDGVKSSSVMEIRSDITALQIPIIRQLSRFSDDGSKPKVSGVYSRLRSILCQSFMNMCLVIFV